MDFRARYPLVVFGDFVARFGASRLAHVWHSDRRSRCLPLQRHTRVISILGIVGSASMEVYELQ